MQTCNPQGISMYRYLTWFKDGGGAVILRSPASAVYMSYCPWARYWMLCIITVIAPDEQVEPRTVASATGKCWLVIKER